MKKSNRTSKIITVQFFSYEDITLKLYLDVIKSLDYKRLLIAGEASLEQCHKQWDTILQGCNRSSGGLDYVNFIDLSQGYGYLLSEYNIVKGWLTKLWFQVDDLIIEQLSERGYNIITTKDNPSYEPELYKKFAEHKKENLSLNYRESLLKALQRSEHLVTKIKMKANELRVFLGGGDGGRKEMVFDEIMAHFMVRGIKVDDDIKLIRYIELIKLLKTSTEEKVYG